MATDALKRIEAHLAAHGVGLARTPLTLGRGLELDRASSAIVNVTGAEPAILERARFLCQGAQRPPYLFPAAIS